MKRCDKTAANEQAQILWVTIHLSSFVPEIYLRKFLLHILFCSYATANQIMLNELCDQVKKFFFLALLSRSQSYKINFVLKRPN